MKKCFLLCVALFHSLSVLAGLDVYSDFVALQNDTRLTPHVDYSIQINDRKSPVTVMAIHGGIIEPPTDQLAGLFAEKYGFNSYIFKSHYAGPPEAEPDTMYLHVTATHFNDPKLLDMTKVSKTCISFHGNDAQGRVACVGGRDQNLRQKVAKGLRESGVKQKLEMEVDSNSDGIGWKNPTCRKYSGTHRQNIVNHCAHGLQLELSLELRRKLGQPEDRALLDEFLKVIRDAVESP